MMKKRLIMLIIIAQLLAAPFLTQRWLQRHYCRKLHIITPGIWYNIQANGQHPNRPPVHFGWYCITQGRAPYTVTRDT